MIVRYDAGRMVQFGAWMYAKEGMFPWIGLWLGLISYVIAQGVSLGALDTYAFTWVMLLPSMILVPFMGLCLFSLYVHKYCGAPFYGENETAVYRSFSPANKVLAQPLLEKIYLLSSLGGDRWSEINQRKLLLRKIHEKDIAEKSNAVSVDDSDVQAVKMFLESYKELT